MEELKFRELSDILRREVDLLRALHSILTEEQNALVEGDVGKIKENVENQISMLKEISGLEEQRESVLQALNLSSADGGVVRLDSLIEWAPEGEASSLREIRSAMHEVLSTIGTVNRHNGMLINQSLSYVDRTLKMIAGEDPSSKVYTPDGEVRCRTGQIVVDREI